MINRLTQKYQKFERSNENSHIIWVQSNFNVSEKNISFIFSEGTMSSYLLTLPLCAGVSRMRALSPAHTFSSRTISPNKKLVFFLQSPYLFTIDQLFPSIVEMFRINFYRVSLNFSLGIRN